MWSLVMFILRYDTVQLFSFARVSISSSLFICLFWHVFIDISRDSESHDDRFPFFEISDVLRNVQ